MKFDVVVGNPPYVDSSKGKAIIWDKFMLGALSIGTIVALVVPKSLTVSNYAGNGICRQELLKSGLKQLTFVPMGMFENATVLTCYFVADRNYQGKAVITDIYKNQYHPYSNIFPSHALVAGILDKITRKSNSFNSYKFKKLTQGTGQCNMLVEIVNKTTYTSVQSVSSQADVDKYKIVTTYLNNGPKAVNYDNDMIHLKAIQVVPPGTGIKTKHRYLVADDLQTATRIANYLRTNFCNAIWAYTRTSRTLDNPQVRFIPAIGHLADWNDDSLCKYFNLSDNESKFIKLFY